MRKSICVWLMLAVIFNPLASVAQSKSYRSITFRGQVTRISNDDKENLKSIAETLKVNSTSQIVLDGYSGTDKTGQNLANARVAAIKTYLVEGEGISADRITTNVDFGGGDSNVVDIKDDDVAAQPAVHVITRGDIKKKTQVVQVQSTTQTQTPPSKKAAPAKKPKKHK